MAHFEAIKGVAAVSYMALDTSPDVINQAQSATLPDTSPLVKRVAEYLTNCLIEDKTAGTMAVYSQRLYDLAHRLKELTPASLREYFQSLIARGLSSNTRNAYYRAFNTFFSWMIVEGYLQANPLANIKPPRKEDKVVKPFSMDDIRKLLLLTSGSRFLEIRNRALLLMFLDTGIRLAEMSRILRADIDILSGIIMVKGKGRKERRVRIGKSTRKALYKYLCQRSDIFPELWVSEERRPMTRDGVKITIVKLCRRAGIKGGPHKIRHTAAINYLRNGGTEFTLQVMLGHSTLNMTRHYVSSLNAEDMMKVHEKASPVDNLLK
jgi:site-specific recombinase XerD